MKKDPKSAKTFTRARATPATTRQGRQPGAPRKPKSRRCRFHGNTTGGRRRRRRPRARNPRGIRADGQGADAGRARAADEVLQEHDPADLAIAAASRLPAAPRQRLVPDRSGATDARRALSAQPAPGRHPLPLMHELADQTGESVSIYSRNGDVRVCIHRVDSKHAVRDHVREGDVLPLDRGSGGRILLAFGAPRASRTKRSAGILLCLRRRARSETAGVSVPFFGSGQVSPRRADAGGSAVAHRRDIHCQCARTAAARLRPRHHRTGRRRISHRRGARADARRKARRRRACPRRGREAPACLDAPRPCADPRSRRHCSRARAESRRCARRGAAAATSPKDWRPRA